MLTRILAYIIVALGVTQGLTGWWLDHDERALGAVPAQIQAARLQDANTASAIAKGLLSDRAALNQVNSGIALKAQATADLNHEKVMLGIQHRQDLASFYFGDATHDPLARSWAAQPVPLSYVLGMCAALGGAARGCGDAAAGGELIGAGAGGGPGAVGRDESPGPDDHGKPAAGGDEGSRGPG